MPLIKCADCGKEIYDMAQSCPYCGRPVAQNSILHIHWGNIKGNTFLKTQVFLDGNEVSVMKCGEYVNLNVLPGTHKIELYFRNKCEICETIEIKHGSDEYFAYKQTLTGLKRVSANSVRWEGISSGDICVPKCPTCGSTKIKKISMTRRVASAEILGIASRSAMKSFSCKNCGYKW